MLCLAGSAGLPLPSIESDCRFLILCVYSDEHTNWFIPMIPKESLCFTLVSIEFPPKFVVNLSIEITERSLITVPHDTLAN